MDIIKHLDWKTPSIEINDGAFNIDITEGRMDISCEWDYGYGGGGRERVSIPIHLFELLLEQYKKA